MPDYIEGSDIGGVDVSNWLTGQDAVAGGQWGLSGEVWREKPLDLSPPMSDLGWDAKSFLQELNGQIDPAPRKEIDFTPEEPFDFSPLLKQESIPRDGLERAARDFYTQQNFQKSLLQGFPKPRLSNEELLAERDAAAKEAASSQRQANFLNETASWVQPWTNPIDSAGQAIAGLGQLGAAAFKDLVWNGELIDSIANVRMPNMPHVADVLEKPIDQQLNPVRVAGESAQALVDVAKAVPADVAEGWTAEENIPEGSDIGTFRNLKAALRREPLPLYEELKGESGVAGTLAHASEGLSDTLARVYLMRGLQGVGYSEPAAGAMAFGLNKEGYDPVAGATGALMPEVIRYGRDVGVKATEKLIEKGVVSAESTATHKLIEETSGLAAVQAFNTAMAAPELAELYKKDPEAFWQKMGEDTVANLGFLAMNAPKAFSRGPSETQRPYAELPELREAALKQRAADEALQGTLPNRGGDLTRAVEALRPSDSAPGLTAEQDGVINRLMQAKAPLAAEFYRGEFLARNIEAARQTPVVSEQAATVRGNLSQTISEAGGVKAAKAREETELAKQPPARATAWEQLRIHEPPETIPVERPAQEPQLKKEEKLWEVVHGEAEADRRYDALPESRNGKVIGTDIARELDPDYAASREGKMLWVGATEKPSRWYAENRIQREVSKPGEGKSLLITAGGIAAGKSSILTPEVVARHDLVWDATLRNPDLAERVIRKAVANGWRVKIDYMHRPMANTLEAAAIRANSEGRWVKLARLPEMHRETQRSVVELHRRLENMPVEFTYWTNPGTPSHPASAKKVNRNDVAPGGRAWHNESKESLSHEKRVAEQIWRKLSGEIDPEIARQIAEISWLAGGSEAARGGD